MSYLDQPRINFTGRFFTNVSTINNDLANYDPSTPVGDPGWNPNGVALFQFDSCTAPYYLLEASPASQTVVAGNTATYIVTVNRFNGHSAPVPLYASGLPPTATQASPLQSGRRSGRRGSSGPCPCGLPRQTERDSRCLRPLQSSD